MIIFHTLRLGIICKFESRAKKKKIGLKKLKQTSAPPAAFSRMQPQPPCHARSLVPVSKKGGQLKINKKRLWYCLSYPFRTDGGQTLFLSIHFTPPLKKQVFEKNRKKWKRKKTSFFFIFDIHYVQPEYVSEYSRIFLVDWNNWSILHLNLSGYAEGTVLFSTDNQWWKVTFLAACLEARGHRLGARLCNLWAVPKGVTAPLG